MNSDTYQQAKDDAQEITPVSEEAVKAFEHSFPKILDLVNEKFALETKFLEGDAAHLPTGMLRDMHKRFGELLGAVYEFHLYENLFDEFSWYITTYSKRGFGEDFFRTMIKTWDIGIHSVIKPPQSHELACPLQWLQRNFSLIYQQSSDTDVALPDEMRLFVDLLLSKKRKEAANHMLLLLNQGVAIEKLYTDLLTTALREIGRRWQKNEISVVDVHVATDICRYIIMRLVDSIPIKRSLPHRALVTCVPGEEHEMGAEIVENFLELKGWIIESMGHIAPESDIMKSIVSDKPDAVFLSATIFTAFKKMIPILDQAYPDHSIIVRPHPTENQQVYKDIAKDCQRVKVTNEGNVVPWLMATDVVIHNGCTTGVEAYMMDVPAISYRARINEKYDMGFYRLPNLISHECFDIEQLQETLTKIFKGELGTASGDQRRELVKHYLAAQDGPLACERIVDVLEEKMKRQPVLPKPPLSDRISGSIIANYRRIYKNIKKHLPGTHAPPHFHRHRYPGISLQELINRIDKIQQVLGDTSNIKAEQVSDQIFLIRP